LSDSTISCKYKRQELEKITSKISRLLALFSRFKSNNEEYLKIKSTVEEEVNKVLIDGKVLLQFALISVIEALRRNPDKYNDLVRFDIPSSSTIVTKQSPPLHIEEYEKILLDEAKRLYDSLLIYLTNSIMDNAAFKLKSLPSSLSISSSRRLNQSDIFRIEDSEIHDSKGDIAN
jgi:hypothetical protein